MPEVGRTNHSLSGRRGAYGSRLCKARNDDTKDNSDDAAGAEGQNAAATAEDYSDDAKAECLKAAAANAEVALGAGGQTKALSIITGLAAKRAPGAFNCSFWTEDRARASVKIIRVRFGSLAAATADGGRVRFTPESCRGRRRPARQLGAKRRHSDLRGAR
jgi:hypothetical protein